LLDIFKVPRFLMGEGGGRNTDIAVTEG